jgi:hypothetical protein
MLLSNLVEYFPGRAGSTMRNILKALPDGLVDIRARGDIQQALVSFGVLNDGLSLALDREHWGPFALLSCLINTLDRRRNVVSDCMSLVMSSMFPTVVEAPF